MQYIDAVVLHRTYCSKHKSTCQSSASILQTIYITMAQLVQYNKPTMAILFMAILCWCPVARASANHFQYWYPQWSEGLQTTLQDECSGLFRGYIDRTFSWCDGQDGLGKEGCYVGSVVDCVLGNLRESWKADSMCFFYYSIP